MAAYVVRRVLWGVALLFLVSLATFVVFYALPASDPALLRAGKHPTPELVERIRHSLELDEPAHAQYLDYMRRLVLHFDLGFSFQNDAPVREQILDRLPATASLTAGAVAIALVFGVLIGVAGALRPGSVGDRLGTLAGLVAISAPTYWLGLVALYLFADDVGRLPLLPGAGSYVGLTEDPMGWLGALLLPWLVVAATFAAAYARLVRANLIEAMSADFVRTARAKGLSERRVVVRHGLRAALTPTVTVLGLDVGVLLGGAVLTEAVFNIPGVGRLAVDAIERGDLPTIQGTVLFAAFFIVVANLLVDLAYGALDPRVRYR